MAEAPKYSIRPFSKPARTDGKDTFRIYLSPATLLLHKLRAGDPCSITGPHGPAHTAIAWPAAERIQDNVLQTSKALQSLYGFKLGDKVSISKRERPVQKVVSVSVSEKVQHDVQAAVQASERGHWEWFLELPLRKAEFICTGMILDSVELKDSRRTFTVDAINGQDSQDLYQFAQYSTIYLEDTVAPAQSTQPYGRRLEISGAAIGGLDRQIRQINERLSAYRDDHPRLKMPSWFRRRRGGILLHGPAGTGKSLVLSNIASAPFRKVFYLDDSTVGRNVGDGEAAVRNVFADAHQNQPSVIIADQLETIAAKAGTSEGVRGSNMLYVLRRELEASRDSHVLFVATTRRLMDIDESLRVPGRLEFEIEIPIPDANARIEILKILQGSKATTSNPLLERLGEHTHGYVGADLASLLLFAGEKAESRYIEQMQREEFQGREVNGLGPQCGQSPGSREENEEILVEVTEADLDHALTSTAPTAMREVFLETPKVRWDDVGGQRMVKQSLREAVEWPFKYASEMERLGMEPKKGLLLYGPPGCSKTLIAKAVATEAGLNFIAIKGGELLSMYVGESERAVREVFRKARAASPSIIFFDEIDAIGVARGGSSSHSGLNVLTTMLNEMDGIEALKGVFVLAATNKPEVLDPALMRPGRIDTILYVGLPDGETRKEILYIRLRRMDVKYDISAEELAMNTDGYSGAEVVDICQRASFAALKEQEDTGISQQISRRHFDAAIAEVAPMTTPEMLSSLEAWAARRTKKS